MQNDLLKPTHLKILCAQYGLTPSRDFGQHYLITEAPISAMLNAAFLSAGSKVVEVGPGFGTLTFRLAQEVDRVIAFEIEQKLKPYWQEQLVHQPNIEIVWGDALSTVPRYLVNFTEPYTVIANLPYQIASRIVRIFLNAERQPEQMIVMVQKEVADRITAPKGTTNLLALGVRYFARAKIIARVSPGSFWPAPKVASAVVHIHDIHRREYVDEFFTLARAGFAHRRKQLWRNLQTVVTCSFDRTRKIVSEVSGTDSTVRAQDLSLEQWEILAQQLRPYLSTE